MSLQIIIGTDRTIDAKVVRLALDNFPSILVDASNSANLHKFPEYDPEHFNNVHVIEVEALYRLTTTLKKIHTIARAINISKIFITTFRLFNYDDEQEINNIYIYAWELLNNLARDFNIVVGVEKGSIHEHLAKMHDAKVLDMGHTLTSQRMIVDNILNELEHFGKSLSTEDRRIYAELLKEPLKHLGNITYTSSMNTWAIMLLCIILEREKNERMAHRHIQGREQSSIMDKDTREES
jgi:hypothetical protein